MADEYTAEELAYAEEEYGLSEADLADCEHGLSAWLCMGPGHYWSYEEEKRYYEEGHSNHDAAHFW